MVQQIVAICPTQYLFGTIIIIVLALSIHGILQYAGAIPSGKNNFAVTGNFDNPAGFASALACTLPLCFLFFTNKKRYVRNASMNVATIITIATILSGSRAGMMGAGVAIAGYFFVKSKIENRKSKIIQIVLIVILFCSLLFALYFIKKDSADGRLLIWQCTSDMVAEKPVFGHGQGAFQAKYMLYQAEYMNTYPDNRFAPLADNVLHPFNEYLLIIAEHGFTGLGMMVLLVFFLVKACRRNHSKEKLPVLMSLLALAVFSFFSYPFRYPFTWVLFFMNLAIIY